MDGTLGTCSTATACYTYDAFGHRVSKTTSAGWRDYLYDTAGNVFTEITALGYTVGYVYANGSLLAQFKNGTTYFIHGEHLGSTRLVTGVNQSVVQNLDYLPFGELSSGDSGITSHKFTGAEHDSESGLDHTWFRKYSSSQGRWPSPDPLGRYAADPGNPQSWNGYAYVLNNPLAFIDPFGLDECFTDPISNITSCIGHYDSTTVTASPLGPGDFGGFFGGGGNEGPGELIYRGGLYGGGGGNSGGGNQGGRALQPNCPDPLLPGCSVVVPTAEVNAFITKFACGSAPQDAVIKSMRSGAARGAVRGAIVGFGGGEFMGGIGGVPGAILGGFMGGTFGAAGAVITGTVRVGVCSAAGAYGK